MFNIHTVEIDWGGRPLKLETGKIARQADGAVIATYGETVVIATVVAAKTAKDGIDFLPLTVDYIEKTYRSSSPCCRTTWKTIRTFWRWSPPLPR
jgi:polyribonucleotide nucleotidyltransferase